ncbi:MAG: DUF4332 domain-containing protein [Pirellulaceae bacterium]
MKLTEIAIEGYHGTRNTRLDKLGEGLNVVYSSQPAIQDALGNFVREIFYGPAATHPSHMHWPQGYIHVISGGYNYQLSRTCRTEYGQLSVSDLHGGPATQRTPDFLHRLDQSVFESFFNVPFAARMSLSSSFVERLRDLFELGDHYGSGRMPFAGDQSSFDAWKASAMARITRLQTLNSEIDRLNSQRTRLLAEQENARSTSHERLRAIRSELAELQTRCDTLQQGLTSERDRLVDLQRQIDELTRYIDLEEGNTRHVPVSRPKFDYLSLFYERLDEIDNQIRRWRSVQSDIQNERVRLRDDMVANDELNIESHDHPYHGTRDIVSTLEHKVRQTEELAATWAQTPVTGETRQHMSTLCHSIRDDLQALCDELGRQYRHVRHKAAVAELKQLRRCYHEMDENVTQLLKRREVLIGQISELDPAGADAIIHADLQFVACAEQEGFLAARRRFVTTHPVPTLTQETEYQTVSTDLAAERVQLADLQRRYRLLSDQIAPRESEIRSLEPRRNDLLGEQDRLARLADVDLTSDIHQIDRQIRDLMLEQSSLQTQVETDRPWLDWKPGYLLGEASRLLAQLSAGRLDQVWIDPSSKIEVRRQNSSVVDSSQLSGPEQQLVQLGLSLAAVSQLALRGIRLPMIIRDTGVSDSIVSTLSDFCRHGHQVLLVSANKKRLEQALQHQATVFDLPDTNITTPTWYPETPAIPRHDNPPPPPSTPSSTFYHPPKQLTASNSTGPFAVKPADYHGWTRPNDHQATAEPIDYVPTPVIESPRTRCSRETVLQDIDLVESIYLTPMESLGIRTVGQLLDMDLTAQEKELARRGFNVDQIDRWQAQAWLLICLPELGTNDARVLVGSGIDRPELIMQMPEGEILERIKRYLDSSAGRRSNVAWSQFSTGRIRQWASRLRDTDHWRSYTRSRYRSRDKGTRRTGDWSSGNRRTASASRRSTAPLRTRSTRGSSTSRTAATTTSAYRFYLNQSDDIDAAPSIGARSAERFYDIGIETVDDFLAADADEMAGQLENRRMSAKVLRTWQKQSRLMCHVPNLRGHDVQILVACGITEPTDLATMNADSLLQTVTKFVKTKEGLRVLRNGKQPDLDEIHEWIDAANHGRTLKAA